jgi:hypothetical protein
MTVSSASLSKRSAKGGRVLDALGELSEREGGSALATRSGPRTLGEECEAEGSKTHLGPSASLGVDDVLSEDETVLDAEGSRSVGFHIQRAGETLVSDPGNGDAHSSDCGGKECQLKVVVEADRNLLGLK